MIRTDRMKDVRPRRLWTSETRACDHCRAPFAAKYRDEIFCSAKCGRLARGCDKHGRPLQRRVS